MDVEHFFQQQPTFNESYTYEKGEMISHISIAGQKKRICVYDNYMEFMTSSAEELRIYLEGGADPLSNSDRGKDLDAIRKLDKGKVRKAYEKCWFGGETDPNKMIKVANPYVEACLELGKTLNPKNTGELQLGYAINVLTINYGKIKDWKNVKKWIELFFDLPDNYRKRSCESEIEGLRKRLMRAKKSIGIINNNQSKKDVLQENLSNI